MPKKLSSDCATALARNKKHAMIRKLAATLSSVGHIPADGTHLICILGNGEEKTNLQALTHWAMGYQSEIDALKETGDDPVNFLLSELSKKLDYPLSDD